MKQIANATPSCQRYHLTRLSNDVVLDFADRQSVNVHADPGYREKVSPCRFWSPFLVVIT
jgi:hypothetical protein